MSFSGKISKRRNSGAVLLGTFMVPAAFSAASQNVSAVGNNMAQTAQNSLNILDISAFLKEYWKETLGAVIVGVIIVAVICCLMKNKNKVDLKEDKKNKIGFKNSKSDKINKKANEAVVLKEETDRKIVVERTNLDGITREHYVKVVRGEMLEHKRYFDFLMACNCFGYNYLEYDLKKNTITLKEKDKKTTASNTYTKGCAVLPLHAEEGENEEVNKLVEEFKQALLKVYNVEAKQIDEKGNVTVPLIGLYDMFLRRLHNSSENTGSANAYNRFIFVVCKAIGMEKVSNYEVKYVSSGNKFELIKQSEQGKKEVAYDFEVEGDIFDTKTTDNMFRLRADFFDMIDEKKMLKTIEEREKRVEECSDFEDYNVG